MNMINEVNFWGAEHPALKLRGAGAPQPPWFLRHCYQASWSSSELAEDANMES